MFSFRGIHFEAQEKCFVRRARQGDDVGKQDTNANLDPNTYKRDTNTNFKDTINTNADANLNENLKGSKSFNSNVKESLLAQI